MKELKETTKLMTSTDYKERFVAEYWQTKIRYEKLKAFNTFSFDKISLSSLDFLKSLLSDEKYL